MMASQNDYTDDDILAQMEAIKKETAQPNRVGDLEPIESLFPEFENNELFLKKVKNLAQKFTHIRRVSRDGSCFYRALLYGFLEDLVNRINDLNEEVAASGKRDLKAFEEMVVASLKGLSDLGYPDVCEDFQESMLDQIQAIVTPNETRAQKLDALLEAVRDFGASSSLIMYLRLITSMSLQQNSALFEPFLVQLGFLDLRGFCKYEVELMEREADHPQIAALSMIMKAGLEMDYLDLSPGDSCNTLKFQEDLPVRVSMLYRPGHYDLLYKLQSKP